MTYEQQILKILSEADERGISVSALTKHLYNLNCTFFFTPDLQELKQYVQQYLLKNSKSSQSLVENTGRRGYYRLNTQNSADARQLMLNFQQEKDDEIVIEDTSEQDLSLSLFNDDLFEA